MANYCVKLDDLGRVVGCRPGPVTPGWADVTDEVAIRADPLHWRWDGVTWVEMSDAECAQRDFDHA